MSLVLEDQANASVRPRPKWYVRAMMVAFRTVVLTVLFTALGMGVGLLSGIVITMALATVRHVSPNMTLAYRHFAIPAAIVAGFCGFLWSAISVARDAARERTRRRV